MKLHFVSPRYVNRRRVGDCTIPYFFFAPGRFLAFFVDFLEFDSVFFLAFDVDDAFFDFLPKALSQPSEYFLVVPLRRMVMLLPLFLSVDGA